MMTTTSIEAPALETRGLSKAFGALKVVSDVNFRLERGARQALVGPNGAGKTTFINLLNGNLKPSAGRVFVAGQDISKLPVYGRVHKGLARTFQINQLLREFSVLENVQLAILEAAGQGSILLGGKAAQKQAALAAYEILESLNLADDAGSIVAELAYGRQRLVEIAVALALRPAVLLLDEPAAGVPPADSHAVFNLIEALPKSVSVLFVEHDMKIVARFAEKISVLVAGKLVREGTPADIAKDKYVRDIYLGHRNHE
jgi:branched-chain amino acid transport system ATP-binding protein